MRGNDDRVRKKLFNTKGEIIKRIQLVLGEREIEVLHRLIYGNNMRAIGNHMKLSSTTIFRVRNYVLNQIMK
ncbi:hypothetical protein ACZ11_09810 [Lysinibacillus xylanilyticus]|uniref:HTH luxR-type domain-containing protein n=1 Tax=Lysinibacillus xylanilyticus TaxID=582475 RepID=A0A0K9FDZ6_9BACI|nr:hypothetical protein ACZ11_09810 [Lysinibacillus xylanilyticus]